MERSLIALMVVILYVIALFGSSFYAKAKQKKQLTGNETSEDFLLAGKSIGLIATTVTVVGAAVGANGTVGVAQNAYSFGLSAGWYTGAFGIGIMLTAIFFVKKLRSLNINTISQIYGDYYGESSRLIASGGQLLINFCINIAQYIGGGAILSSLLPQYFTMTSGMIVSFVLYLVICMIGGMASTALTNVVNILLLYVAIAVAVIFTLNDAGGWVSMVSKLPDPELYTSMVDGLTLSVLGAYLILYLCNASCTQASTQMLFSAKNEKVAFWSFLIGGLLVIPVGFGSAIIGMAGRVLFPAIENTAAIFPTVVMTFPGVVAGIVLAGMWAANVSTATTLIMSGANLYVTDIYIPLKKGTSDAAAEIKVSKISTVVFAVTSLLCAFYVTQLLDFITTFSSIVAGYFILLVATIYFPNLCKKTTANAVMISNLIILALWVLLPQIHIVSHVLYLQLIVSIIAFAICALVDKRPAFFRTNDYELKFGKKAFS